MGSQTITKRPPAGCSIVNSAVVNTRTLAARVRYRQEHYYMNTNTQEHSDYRFVIGLLTGAVVGAGLAMWFAPRMAPALRRQMTDSARNLGKLASDQYQQASTRVGKAVDEFARKGQAARDEVAMSERAATRPSQTRVVLQILLIIAGAAFGLWALHRLASVVFVLIFAALFAYVIAPLVQLAERPIRIAGRPRCLSRGPAIALVYVLIAGSVAAAAALLLPSATQQVNDMISRAPAYAQSIIAWEHGWARSYERLRIPVELRQSIDQSVLASGEAAVQSARGALRALVGALSDLPWLILVPILAFFLLKDATSFRRIVIVALPYRIRLRGHRLFEDLNATLAADIHAQLLACVLVGSLCWLGFAVLGVPYPVVLGVLAGVLEFIPLVGPLLVAIAASIVGALQA